MKHRRLFLFLAAVAVGAGPWLSVAAVPAAAPDVIPGGRESPIIRALRDLFKPYTFSDQPRPDIFGWRPQNLVIPTGPTGPTGPDLDRAEMAHQKLVTEFSYLRAQYDQMRSGSGAVSVAKAQFKARVQEVKILLKAFREREDRTDPMKAQTAVWENEMKGWDAALERIDRELQVRALGEMDRKIAEMEAMVAPAFVAQSVDREKLGGVAAVYGQVKEIHDQNANADEDLKPQFNERKERALLTKRRADVRLEFPFDRLKIQAIIVKRPDVARAIVNDETLKEGSPLVLSGLESQPIRVQKIEEHFIVFEFKQELFKIGIPTS